MPQQDAPALIRFVMPQVLRKVLGSVFLPSTAIFHWLETHAQIRLSILLTYLFGESILFVHLLTWLDRAWSFAGYALLVALLPERD